MTHRLLAFSPSRLLAFVTFVVLVFPARALAQDPDGDGYTTGSAPPDCKEGDAQVNPNAAETVGDGVDQDCDGTDALRQHFTSAHFAAVNWPATGVVTRGPDGVTLGNGTVGGSITIDLSVPMRRGAVFLTAAVDWKTGSAACTAVVKTGVPGGAPTTASVNITAGELAYGPLTVTLPGGARRLLGLSLSCPAGSQMHVDWLAAQNSAVLVGPIEDWTVDWVDVEAPGGGLSTSIARASSDGTLWAASDVGGVARWSAGDDGWQTANGTAPDALLSAADLSVWDVLPASDGNTWLLTGAMYDGGSAAASTVAGGLWRSEDDGVTWHRLAESKDAAEAGVGVAGFGRYSEVASTSNGPGFVYARSGGALLAEEGTRDDFVYIANGDEDELGVWIYDGTEVCEMPHSGDTLPAYDADSAQDGHARALARVDSAPNGLPALIIGYHGRGAAESSLFLCQLPLDDLDSDGFDEVALSCSSGSPTATCTAIADAVGLDVRDLELDPLGGDRVFVADGGDDPSLGDTDADGVHWFLVEDDGTDVEATTFSTIPSAFTVTDLDLTGISIDPAARYLFGFVPKTPDSAYGADRIYRLDYSLIETATTSDWEALNGDDADEPDRFDRLDIGAHWLGASTVARPDPYAARHAPGEAVDATWLTGISIPMTIPYYGTPISIEDEEMAILSTTFELWGVFGLTWDDDYCFTIEGLGEVCPEAGWWDSDAAPYWIAGPWGDPENDRTYQYSVVNDIAGDAAGNLWMPAADIGLFELPSGGEVAERDCLWDGYNAGGSEVSVADMSDGSGEAVWFTLYDQRGGVIPQNIGVMRTLDYGGSWTYEGGALDERATYPAIPPYDAVCRDEDTGHVAAAMGNGVVLNNGLPTEADPSFGNPLSIVALSDYTAVVLFQSYEVGGDADDGSLRYTLDGGGTWTEITFDGDFDSDSGTVDCDEDDFYRRPRGLALLGAGTRSYGNDTDLDGTVEASEWALDLVVASRSAWASGTHSDEYKYCGLARVQVTATTTAWTWIPLEWGSAGSGGVACYVDDRNIGGVATTAWSDEVFLYGDYQHYNGATPEDVGGVCQFDISNPSGTLSGIVAPSTHEYSIGDVGAHPTIDGLVMAVPRLDAGNWIECMENNAESCPHPPSVLLLDRTGSASATAPVTWAEFAVSAPPHAVGTAAGWLNSTAAGDLLMATAGGGAWRGTVSW